MLKFLRLAFLISWCMACVTHDASFHNARTLPKGESSHGVSGHYLLVHKNSVWHDRLKSSRKTNYRLATVANGLSYHYRHAWREKLEFNSQLSLESSSLGGVWNPWRNSVAAWGLYPKLLFPLTSFDLTQTYQLGLSMLSSMVLNPNLHFIFSPSFYIKPAGGDRHISLGGHIGFQWQKISQGFGIEASFYEDHYLEFSSNKNRSREQIKFAWFSNLPEIPSSGLLPDITINPSVVWLIHKEVALGLDIEFQKSSLLLVRGFSVSRSETVEESGFGIFAYPLNSIIEAGAGIRVLDVNDKRSRKTVFIQTISPGPFLSLGNKVNNWHFRWFSVFYPISFLSYHRYGGSYALAKSLGKKPSLFFLKTTYIF